MGGALAKPIAFVLADGYRQMTQMTQMSERSFS
jgi:hypothetical protein